MECRSDSSIADFLPSSEGKSEVAMMALYVERQMSEPIPIPDGPPTASYIFSEPRRPNMPPFPPFDQTYFSLGRGKGPLKTDSRVKRNHPINLCRNLIPQVDTSLSTPALDKGQYYPVSTSSSVSYVLLPRLNFLCVRRSNSRLSGEPLQRAGD